VAAAVVIVQPGPDAIHVAEAFPGGTHRLLPAEPASFEFLDAALQMEADFVVHVGPQVGTKEPEIAAPDRLSHRISPGWDGRSAPWPLPWRGLAKTRRRT
jgi:hypothetical protein